MQEQSAITFKYIALVALVLQNSGSALSMRFTLVYPSPEGTYIPSTCVFLAEVMKLLISFTVYVVHECKFDITVMKDTANEEFVLNRSSWLKLAVPSLLYTLQNSLQYFSMSQLSAPVFQVLCQFKIIATAFFSVIILQRRLNIVQWLSIVSLSLGVAIVQLSQMKSSDVYINQYLPGFLSVIVASMTSGFSGVYFEMVLKSSKASIWIRNIQLSTIGIFVSVCSCYVIDRHNITQRGFFIGYNLNLWGVILLQAAGGLIVAIVVKHADNILKGYATSIAIMVSCFISGFIFGDVTFSSAFVGGNLLVVAAVFLYGGVPYSSQLLPFVNRFQTKKIAT